MVRNPQADTGLSHSSQLSNLNPIGEYPRILLITSSVFNLQTGGGVALTTMFKGWPKDRIANIYHDILEPDDTVCENFYRLTTDEIGWVFPISLLFQSYKMRRERRSARPGKNQSDRGFDSSQHMERSGSQGVLKRWIASSGTKLLQALGGEAFYSRVNLTEELRDWIETFEPDLVYGTLGDLVFLELTRFIADEYKLPTVVHTYDDWLESRYRSGVFASFYRSKFIREYGRAFKRARLRFGISNEMCHAYKRRYDLEFITCTTPVEVDSWLQHSKADWSFDNEFRIVYVGSIHPLGQRQSLLDIANVVTGLHSSDKRITLDIYTPEIYILKIKESIEALVGISVHLSPPSPQIGGLLGAADLLVLPVNFDSASYRAIRYSSPAKTAAYMMSSTPILVYGPPSVPPVRYATDEGWGYIVCEQGEDKLKAAIEQLMVDEAMRKSLGLRAQKLAIENHDAVELRGWFHDLIIRILNE